MTTVQTMTTATTSTTKNTSPVRVVEMDKRQQIIWRPKEGGTRTPHSLIISPNLDALLEYDEKVRGTTSPISPHGPQSAPPAGLPPPPRRNLRKPRSPTSPKVGSPLIQEASAWADTNTVNVSGSQNPYINPAPVLEESRMPGPGGETLLANRAESSAHGQLTIGGGSADGEECSVAIAIADVQKPPGQPSLTQISKNRVDKLFGIGKRPFTLFNDPNPKAERKTGTPTQLGDVSNTQRTPGLNLRERAKAKGKLLKLNSQSSNDRMRHARDDLVLDIRRHSTDSDTDMNNTWDTFRRRPLLSHVRPSSQGSSTSSSYSSTSSTTTHEPASTIDARISISSTMYPTSTVYSHGIYIDESLPIVPPNRSSSLYSRQSFIDIGSPDTAEFSLPGHMQRRDSPSPPRTPDRNKPPIPTAPKPVFNRSSPKPAYSLPPTTNFLDLDQRSDLIRKNRKLAKVFGQPPGPDAFPQEVSRNDKPPVLPMITAGHQRASLSISNLDAAISQHGVWLPATDFMDARRHSVPLSPDDVQSFLEGSITKQKSSRSPDLPDFLAPDEIRGSSPTSFIDLSDDLGSATRSRPKDRDPSAAAPPRGRPRRPSSPSARSLYESMSPEEQAEETRKRKREKLAKLHRFLGSRVPTNLVLGIDADPALPPLDPTSMAEDEVTRKAWLRRRRSSSAAAYSSTWSDEIDRIKEDLNSTEKAINVRRALKMEKVFGVAPPQTLYHTRRSPSPSVSNLAAITGNKMISGWTSPGESHPPVTGLRNPNRSSYSKPKKTKDNRPGTAESSQALLPKGRNDSKEPDLRRRTSIVYSHYQESLNSLNDIIDRDDKESLAELHEYLNSGDMTVPPPLQPFSRTPTQTTPTLTDRRLSNASSIKSERRRSLPARTSMISVSSEYSVSTPRPEATDFQARRRRAAKLTQFFGVDYRELISDVLESLETGLEHERKRGTLNPEEVEDLLARLRNLRTKRTGYF
ncbi:hypothetical protein DXG01_001010 [Tephrocybe rancida]|nr:hypothetical protein DXG01_001010 [Tephrocybe rancida]